MILLVAFLITVASTVVAENGLINGNLELIHENDDLNSKLLEEQDDFVDNLVQERYDVDYSGKLVNNTQSQRHYQMENVSELQAPVIKAKKICRPTPACKAAGGYCFKDAGQCAGTVDRYRCRGRKCKCCIPAQQCSSYFEYVGDYCMLFEPKKLSWSSARSWCQTFGADLAVIQDANHYQQIVNYVNKVNSQNEKINIWLGGTDEEHEGTWKWITGGLMPHGTPFWGTRNNYLSEPSGGVRENCAALYHRDRYYIHDFDCRINNNGYGDMAPLCQE